MTPFTDDECRDIFRRIHDYVDRELAAGELERVRVHLDACARCAREFRFEAQVIQDVRTRLRRVTAPPGLVSSLLASLRAEPPGSGS